MRPEGPGAGIGYCFRDPNLFREAITHPSAGEDFNNQRLEFLGDAVLDLVIAEHLFDSNPHWSEGEMTQVKASIVNGVALAQRAVSMGLGDEIVTGGGLSDPSLWPDSIYCDAFEAVAGAVYLDGGLEAARQFILDVLSQELEDAARKGAAKDFKSLLLEMTQGGSGARPEYEVINESGASHDKRFVVAVTVGDMSGQGEGRTKKESEQRAAQDLLRAAGWV